MFQQTLTKASNLKISKLPRNVKKEETLVQKRVECTIKGQGNKQKVSIISHHKFVLIKTKLAGERKCYHHNNNNNIAKNEGKKTGRCMSSGTHPL